VRGCGEEEKGRRERERERERERAKGESNLKTLLLLSNLSTIAAAAYLTKQEGMQE
jgi:hypothetical protein